jgi:hypothetical protein
MENWGLATMVDALQADDQVWIELAGNDQALSAESLDDRIAEVTAETVAILQHAIGAVAVGLRPDLKAIGASKATVKIGAKLVVKAGKLAALISEVGAEGTVEVTIEFTAPPA